jgi:hypothetical protein
MYWAHAKEQRQITDDYTDADGQPCPLETVVGKDTLSCLCEEYEEYAKEKDGENVPQISDVLLENQQPI